MVASFKSGETESLYIVKLQTSNISGSSLTDFNSAVLICLIDENGSSILQRLPSVETSLSGNDDMDGILHFQRGSGDEFVFEGPSLGKIVAVWISLDSGQWRIGGINLRMFCCCQFPSENSQISDHIGVQYNFKVEDILLGEKSGISLMEFRPHSVTTLSKHESNLFFENTLRPSSISNEKSMKEYSDLKFSLLFYDAMLVLTGSSIISIVPATNNVSCPFLIGGTCGFLYLLLLQRSVDGLPVQELIPGEDEVVSSRQILERFRGPLLSLVLVFAFAAIAVTYASGEGAVQLTSRDIIFGMMGFLVCKVSVVLAAFKPIPFGLREGK
ncbi:hypothetical protein F511_15231 [Dorcoceras hygrometricum]|uniref:DUF7755 domain-containing protein n=1 Tax=Dorcoceras hygrometricum TaxID=472368 RepID=A0A2Z7CW74_9LAMI|nr:hypothetical protein F511_15231 [Dorcoceras hygrometricum]